MEEKGEVGTMQIWWKLQMVRRHDFNTRMKMCTIHVTESQNLVCDKTLKKGIPEEG